MVDINKMLPSDLSAVLNVFEQCFPDYAPISKSLLKFLNDTVNWSISLKAEQGGVMIGFY